MKPRKTLREWLDGWLSFNEVWFWHPDSGFFGSLIVAAIIIAAMLAWGVVR